MLTFEILNISIEKCLPLRNELEILLSIFLVEKLEATINAIETDPNLPPENYLYATLDTILNFLQQMMIYIPQIFPIIYLNYDVQLFATPIVGNLFKSLVKLATCNINLAAFQIFLEISKNLNNFCSKSEEVINN